MDLIQTILPVGDGLSASALSSLSWLGSVMGTINSFLPDGTAAALAESLAVIVAAKLILLPWLVSLNIKVPFLHLAKR